MDSCRQREPTQESFGAYVHIPYCKHVCPYCDFNVYVARRADWSGFEDALVAELDARAAAFTGAALDSLYFGGGTPSLASPAMLSRLVGALRRRFAVVPGAEVTLEVEPRTVDAASLTALAEAGVNRISLGWQSTHDRLLRVLGRGHKAQDSERAFVQARQAGFDNISIDLIFAVPSQTEEELDRDLDAILQLGPEHVSLYALTFHEGTPYFRWRQSGRVVAIDEELELAMMLRIEERLTACGYEHYEVSNYARPGYRAYHNQIYWRGGRYLGIGPGAHSFWRQGWSTGLRWQGRRDPAAYIEAWQRTDEGAGTPAAEAPTLESWEKLSARQLLSERILVGLRTSDGVDLAGLKTGEAAGELETAACKAQALGWLSRAGSRLLPTKVGLANADALAALFF